MMVLERGLEEFLFCLLAEAQESSNLVDVRYELFGFTSII